MEDRQAYLVLLFPARLSIAAARIEDEAKTYFHFALMAAVAILIIYQAVMIMLRDLPSERLVFSDISSIIINATVTLCLLYAANCSRKAQSKDYYAWLMIAIAQLSFAMGDFIWAYYEIVLQESPFPSPADALYLLYYPLFLVGILLLPAISIKPNERIKLLLDSGIILISSVLFFWSVIIAPTIEQAIGEDPLTIVLSVAYPVVDLVLMLAIAELLFRRMNYPDKRALLLLAAFAFLQIILDAIYMRQNLDGTYVSGASWTPALS